MYRLSVEQNFSSAHFLRNYQGKCENLHGHNWRVVAEVTGDVLDSAGMVTDFGVIRAGLKKVTDGLDHRNLNEDIPFFGTENPSAENISRHVFRGLAPLLPRTCRLAAVTVYETPTSSCRYEE
jgi:6-pyruvoyltetrahydropterin/6-carboxytetrahydropterin synthase